MSLLLPTDREITADQQLHLLLGRLVHAFGRLDFNLGCELKGLGPYRGQEVGELLQRSVPFAHRLQMLERLVMEVCRDSGSAAEQDFSAWFARVHEAKALRNDFAHGRWGIAGRHIPGGLRFEFGVLSWEFDAAKRTEPDSYTPQALEAEVEKVERLFEDFCKLEEKYLRNAKPSLELERAQKART